MIEGVGVKKLNPVRDDRGWVTEILRADDELFERFGQVYLTVAYPGVVKAWHMHRKQTDCFALIGGRALIALYDDREGSSTRGELIDYVVDESAPLLIKIPPGVYHGYKALGDRPAYIINTPTKPYNRENPDEHRLPHDSEIIGYDWSRG